MSPPALRRASRYGNGWYGFAIDLEATGRCVAGLREAQQRVERSAELGPLEISVTPSGALDAGVVSRFEDLGVDRLVLMRGFGDMAKSTGADPVIRFLEDTARELSLG